MRKPEAKRDSVTLNRPPSGLIALSLSLAVLCLGCILPEVTAHDDRQSSETVASDVTAQTMSSDVATSPTELPVEAQMPESSRAPDAAAAEPGHEAPALAKPCSDDAACASGACVDGLCCERRCGTCEVCSSQGQCERVADGASTARCKGEDYACDSEGECAWRDGHLCIAGAEKCAAASTCDARCCRIACGACEVCGGSGNSCEPITDRQDGDACGGLTTCSRGACLTFDHAEPENVTLSERYHFTTAVSRTFGRRTQGKIAELRAITACTGGAPLRASIHRLASDGTPSTELAQATLGGALPGGRPMYSIFLDPPFQPPAFVALVLEAPAGAECFVDGSPTMANISQESYTQSTTTQAWVPLDRPLTFYLEVITTPRRRPCTAANGCSACAQARC